jgi:hypothetical protein
MAEITGVAAVIPVAAFMAGPATSARLRVPRAAADLPVIPPAAPRLRDILADLPAVEWA